MCGRKVNCSVTRWFEVRRRRGFKKCSPGAEDPGEADKGRLTMALAQADDIRRRLLLLGPVTVLRHWGWGPVPHKHPPPQFLATPP